MAHKQSDLAVSVDSHDDHACVDDGIALAEARAAARGLRLTPQRRKVLEILLADHRPMGAYDILEKMADENGAMPAPPIAYRALEFLQGLGLVHRIDRLNAFVACGLDHGDHAGHSACAGGTAFLICEQCHQVTELTGSALQDQLASLAESWGFAVESASIELMGRCSGCQDAA